MLNKMDFLWTPVHIPLFDKMKTCLQALNLPVIFNKTLSLIDTMASSIHGQNIHSVRQKVWVIDWKEVCTRKRETIEK